SRRPTRSRSCSSRSERRPTPSHQSGGPGSSALEGAPARHEDAAAVRSAVLSLLLLSIGCSAPASEDVEALDEAIVGGRAQNHTHPAVGYLAVAYEDTPFCTATLVDATTVITAAHCVLDVRASSLVFGTGKFDRRLRRTRVTHCRSNPRFRDTDWTSQYDFAW